MIAALSGLLLAAAYLGAALAGLSLNSAAIAGVGLFWLIVAVIGLQFAPRTVGMAATPAALLTPIALGVGLVRQGGEDTAVLLAFGLGAFATQFAMGQLRPDAAGQPGALIDRQHRRAKRAVNDWDRVRAGRGPTLFELVEVGSRFGLTSGDCALLGTLGVQRWRKRRPGEDPVQILEQLESDIADGLIHVVGGEIPLRNFVEPGTAAGFAGMALRLVEPDGTDAVVAWVRERLVSSDGVWFANWGDGYRIQLTLHAGRVRARELYEEPPIGHPMALHSRMVLEEAMFQLAEALGVESHRHEGRGLPPGMAHLIRWDPPLPSTDAEPNPVEE